MTDKYNDYKAQLKNLQIDYKELEQQLKAKDEEIKSLKELDKATNDDRLVALRLYEEEKTKRWNLEKQLKTNTYQLCEKIRQNSFSEYELVNGNKALYFTISSDELDKIERGEL